MRSTLEPFAQGYISKADSAHFCCVVESSWMPKRAAKNDLSKGIWGSPVSATQVASKPHCSVTLIKPIAGAPHTLKFLWIKHSHPCILYHPPPKINLMLHILTPDDGINKWHSNVPGVRTETVFVHWLKTRYSRISSVIMNSWLDNPILCDLPCIHVGEKKLRCP